MCCVACVISASDVAGPFAIALLFMSRNKKMQHNNKCNDVCVFSPGFIFEYGLYMCCVACVICASDVAGKCAIALLFISRRKNMQESIRRYVF